MTKQEAIVYINNLPEDSNIEVTVMDRIASSSEVEKLGISRQLLRYWVATGKVRTVPYGKQKKYLLDDINKLLKED
jgi:hypothetical protein